MKDEVCRSGDQNYILSTVAGITIADDSDSNPHVYPKTFQTEVIPTQNCADTENWRKKLVESAEHNILISGNYCGGNTFLELLEMIERRYEAKPELEVIILSSPIFIAPAHLTVINRLKTNFPEKFSFIETPDFWHFNPWAKSSTNHTKCTVIDYGKYFMLGGSNIRDSYTGTGLTDLNRRDFLAQLEGTPQQEIEISNRSIHWTDRLTSMNFRDMDFVFRTTGNLRQGKQIFSQMLLLAHRFEEYHRYCRAPKFTWITPSIRNSSELAVLIESNVGVASSLDTLVTKLLKTRTPVLETITTEVPRFINTTDRSKKAKTTIFSIGPEHDSSFFEATLIKKIRRAKTKILIDHMYFNPTKKILDELKRAVCRGVEIKIISCGEFENCPRSHKIFAIRNRYNYQRLLSGLDDDERPRVEIYEFQQSKVTNHKKVIIIDEHTVIGGSSNFGYKSLATSSDYEINFQAYSHKLAQKTLAVIAVDQAHSVKVSNDISLSFMEHIRAYLYQFNAPLIG